MRLSFEKKAFFAVFVTIIAAVFATFYIGKENLWFEPKHVFYTVIEDADGLYPGSLVTMSGLRVGEVEKLSVNEDNKIEVMFTVRTTLAHKIRSDSVAKVIRSFMIGEKRIEITPGSLSKEVISNFGSIKGVGSRELTDLLSGRNISDMSEKMEKFLTKMDVFLEMLSGIKSEDLEKTSKIIYPTLHHINQIAMVLKKDLIDTKTLQKSVVSFESIATPVAERQDMIQSVLNNTTRISEELEANKRFTSTIGLALDELIVTLKALQKTWVLEDHVNELKLKKTKKEESD